MHYTSLAYIWQEKNIKAGLEYFYNAPGHLRQNFYVISKQPVPLGKQLSSKRHGFWRQVYWLC